MEPKASMQNILQAACGASCLMPLHEWLCKARPLYKYGISDECIYQAATRTVEEALNILNSRETRDKWYGHVM